MNDYNHNGRIDQEDLLIEEELFDGAERHDDPTENAAPALIIVAIICIGLYLKFFG